MFVTGFMLWIMQKESIWYRKREDIFETYNIGGHNEKQNIQIIHIILDTLQEMLPEGGSS